MKKNKLGYYVKYTKKDINKIIELLKRKDIDNNNIIKYIDEDLRNDILFFNKILEIDGSLIKYGTKKIKSNKDLVLLGLKTSAQAYLYANDIVKEDTIVIEKFLNYYPYPQQYFYYIPSKIRYSNKMFEIIKNVINNIEYNNGNRKFKFNSKFIYLMTSKFLKDKKKLEYLVKHFWFVYQDLPKEYRNDKKITYYAIKNNRENIKFIPENLINKKQIQKIIYKNIFYDNTISLFNKKYLKDKSVRKFLPKSIKNQTENSLYLFFTDKILKELGFKETKVYNIWQKPIKYTKKNKEELLKLLENYKDKYELIYIDKNLRNDRCFFEKVIEIFKDTPCSSDILKFMSHKLLNNKSILKSLLKISKFSYYLDDIPKKLQTKKFVLKNLKFKDNPFLSKQKRKDLFFPTDSSIYNFYEYFPSKIQKKLEKEMIEIFKDTFDIKGEVFSNIKGRFLSNKVLKKLNIDNYPNYYQYLSDKKKNNKKLVLKLLNKCNIYNQLPYKLQKDKDVLLKVLELSPEPYLLANQNLKEDKEVIKKFLGYYPEYKFYVS